MIWLQYEDPSDNNGGEFRKLIYEDDAYEAALAEYKGLKSRWDRTRLLFENDEQPTDWVLLQDDSIREDE